MIVALFGGSFDPPHIAHIKIVENSLEKLNIDKIVIMPTYINPFKKKFFASPKLRLKWLKKVFQNSKKIEVCDFEIKQNRVTFAIENIKFLESKGYRVKYFIIGADNLKSLKRWKKFKKIDKKLKFVVFSRNGIKIPKKFKKIELNMDISSTNLRDKFEHRYVPETILSNVKKYYRKIDAK